MSIEQVLGLESATPAVVLTLQTAGEALNFHPHLHGCLADGLFRADGSFLPFKVIEQGGLTAKFGEVVLCALVKEELVSDNEVAQILSQEHTGFNVWLGDPFQDEESDKFVARYIERGPISLQRLSIQDDIVTYSTKDGTAHEFDGLEFLALLSSHIAKPYESLTRYYGFYSCRARGERKKRSAVVGESGNHPDPRPKASTSWAACMKRILEIGPLECPKCKGTMRIIAFIHDTKEISKIMRSLDIAEYARPPPLTKAQPIAESYYEYETN